MKATLVMLFFAAAALGQTVTNNPATVPGCGVATAKFDVKTDKSQHPSAQPESGKALVYFMEDDDSFESNPKPTARIGVDGSWVGANHGDSYFFLSVDPGEHHLCSSWQSFVAFGARETSAAPHFTAEAGQTYYFRVRNTWIGDHLHQVDLLPVDSDEGQLLASRFAFSTSHPKN